MKKEEIENAQELLQNWQREHADIDSLRKAHRASIAKQVWASMAFEGEPVSLKMLEEYMESLKEGKEGK